MKVDIILSAETLNLTDFSKLSFLVREPSGKGGGFVNRKACLRHLKMGFSSTWWVRGHNRHHHAMPQRLKHDVDLETMPLLAYNAKVVKNVQAGKGFMIQNQVRYGGCNTQIIA